MAYMNVEVCKDTCTHMSIHTYIYIYKYVSRRRTCREMVEGWFQKFWVIQKHTLRDRKGCWGNCSGLSGFEVP